MNTESDIPEAGQAGKEEIEITPEMIRAGVWALENNRAVISDAGLVEAVYTAMAACSPRLSQAAA